MKIDSDKYKIYGLALKLDEESGGELVFNSADQFRNTIMLIKGMTQNMVEEIYRGLKRKELDSDNE